jgi:copper chaperone NosL
MSRHTSMDPVVAGSAESPGPARPRPVLPTLVRIASGAAAATLLLAAERLPIWRALFSAPQYPHGLDVAAYGNRVEGDLGEINELSHYIGMPPFDFVGLPEMRLWPVVIGVGMVTAVVAAITRRRWLRRLACTTVWLIPVGALADVQFRLWQVGHSLDPTSPIHVTPFTPRVVGPTTLMNFTVHAFPGTALVLVAVAAAVVTWAPFLARRFGRSSGPVDDAEPTTAEVTVP